MIPRGAEQIPPPQDPAKKMPEGKGGEPPSKQVQIIQPGQPAPVQSPYLQTPPAAPAIVPATPGQERPF